MTIDLGFAHFDLPSERRVGIVDVPGHERLIKNMLAGATGIDLVLFVVAADEGVMPQTREHLDILRYLPVHTGIVVLNKIDLLSDGDWLALVKDDLRALTAGTFLEQAPVLEVSAKTGEGIPVLIETIDQMLDPIPARSVDAPVRLPIDRAFVMAGFGTVVTGTLWSGRISAGNVLEILPEKIQVRVRGVQSHGQEVGAGLAGSRVAVNLVGIEKEAIRRGDVLATADVFKPTELMDVRIRLLPGAPALAHQGRVRLYLGSGETIGRVSLLDRQRLEPGETAIAQARLETPMVAAAGDPFVLRRYSPMTTIGGGEVLSPHAPKRRPLAESVKAIEEATSGLAARLEDVLVNVGRTGATTNELARELAAGKTDVESLIREMEPAGKVISVRGRLFHVQAVQDVAAAIRREIDVHHAAAPWRPGIPKDELKTKAFVSGDNRLYAHVLDELIAEGEFEDLGLFIRRKGFVRQLSADDLRLRDQIAAALKRGQFAPPLRGELAAFMPGRDVFDRIFQTLLDEGLVVEVGDGVVFHRDPLEEIKRITAAEVAEKGSVTVASLRDRLGTSRKFALTVLEYFDTIKLTRRVGDARVLLQAHSTRGS
ncbi:MAG: selenocysteine-specific translation elongation factor [Armatimonadetes bacterium]|nr:selenocysteine-specific translation elongation factor [Armatimonadota bacterium]